METCTFRCLCCSCGSCWKNMSGGGGLVNCCCPCCCGYLANLGAHCSISMAFHPYLVLVLVLVAGPAAGPATLLWVADAVAVAVAVGPGPVLYLGGCKDMNNTDNNNTSFHVISCKCGKDWVPGLYTTSGSGCKASCRTAVAFGLNFSHCLSVMANTSAVK